MDAPLLRSPPFPHAAPAVSRPGRAPEPVDLTPAAIDALFVVIREARVGGCFWGAPGEAAESIVTGSPDTVDPWSVLDGSRAVALHGDDERLALAVIAGCPVEILSPGRFGTPGAAIADVRERIARDLLGVRYRNPFDDQDASIAETIALLADWRRTIVANRGIVAGCGFSWWKRREIARFLWTPGQRLRYFRSESAAIAYAATKRGSVAVWPSRISANMAAEAEAQGVSLVRVEDGFVRSVGLGSNLVPPCSVTVDRRGIHYDPSRPSDLEAMLAEAEFAPDLLARAERLRATIVAAGISKYGNDGAHVFPPRDPARRLVLVPGQVEDDMSVLHGGGGLTSNLELLRRVRALEPDAEIWFRPHPDVDAGHRKGAVGDADASLYADRIVRGGGMAGLLALVDAVHVLTSLTGFEALLRGREVTCHGTPFYAGWSLTHDLSAVPERRGRPLTLDHLVAAVLIVYPRYLDPVTGLPCSPEVLIGRMRDGDAHNRLGWVTRVKRVQGWLARVWV